MKITHLYRKVGLSKRALPTNRPLVRRGIRRSLYAALAIGFGAFLVSCGSTKRPHNGRFPFSMLESPPRATSASDFKKMEHVLEYNRDRPETFDRISGQIVPGDVIGLVMSHEEAWSHLRKKRIQKIPYELFRYGHVALAVPDPSLPTGSQTTPSNIRFLNVAMKHSVGCEEAIDWLRDQSWAVYRPPSGSVDTEKLREFTRTVCNRASDPQEAYDYSGALGLFNAPSFPEKNEEIGEEYTCATLIVAGLHYSGYHLDAIHRGGILDIVTPRQVLESSGVVRNSPTSRDGGRAPLSARN